MGEEVKAKNEKRRTRAYTRAQWRNFIGLELWGYGFREQKEVGG